MGHLVVAHAMKKQPDAERVSSLPASIAWSLYKDDSSQSFYLDLFRRGKAPTWPFTSMPPIQDFPLELPQPLAPLARLYQVLEKNGLANGFKRAFLNINLALSKVTQAAVCSFCTDDDGLDFVCISQDGQLQRLRCVCGDLHITWEPGALTIQPLLVADAEGTDLDSLHDPEQGVHVLQRDVAYPSALHATASDEVMRFLKVQTSPLGLGSVDGMRVQPLKIAGSEAAADLKPADAKKPFWRFW